ncbi:tail fiber domain-containing protein [Cupriavidus sp. 2KB_3]|uniref:tail fiber domain-containing protein n=1 Tax=Cupriavidus sp. 2KB_3 TaxID=3232980 RepID=UPI003F8E48AD
MADQLPLNLLPFWKGDKGDQGDGINSLTASDGIQKTGFNLTAVGTASRIVAGASGIDIASDYVGQASITTLGTIDTGTWQGASIAGQYGGTGVNNAGKTITLGGNLATSGAFSTTLNVTADTNVTLPTSGTLVNSAVAALSNLATVGTITTGVWQGTAVAVANGGTGATSAANARTNLGLGTIATQAASAVAITGGTATFTGAFGQNEASARAWDVGTRSVVTTYPVPTIRPTTTNTTLALDLMPNGTPSESAGNGYAWFDVCNADVKDNNNAVYGARVAATSTGAFYTSFSYNGAAAKPVAFGISNVIKWYIDATGFQFAPFTDNTQSICSAGLRSSVVYSATGAINTSDEREKQDIGAIPDEWLDAWGDVQHVTFRWIVSVQEKGEAARWHVGHIAQQVRDAFAARGLDATKIGLLCYDKWDDNEMGLKAGDRWGIRPDQCMFMESAYMRRELDRIKKALPAA